MKLNGKALVWAGVLAVFFLVAGSSQAQAQTQSICPQGATNCACGILTDFESCSVQFTKPDGVCVTVFLSIEIDFDQCTQTTTRTASGFRDREPGPCQIPCFSTVPECEAICTNHGE